MRSFLPPFACPLRPSPLNESLTPSPSYCVSPDEPKLAEEEMKILK